MSIKNELFFTSRDGISQIKAYTWSPDSGNIRGILQIVHGMNEYMGRYDDFANFITTHDILVVGEDHLGHGQSSSEKDLGYFAPKDGDTILVRDVHRLKKIIQEQHPGIPYFILGHSMGSFILRKYMNWYGTGIQGALVSGTGYAPAATTSFAIFLTRLLGLFYGDRHQSKLIDQIGFGSYTKKIPSPNTSKDWLTRDPEVVTRYINDPYCTFLFSLNAFRGLFKLIRHVCNEKNMRNIPKDLPIYLFSGLADPVGTYGKGPTTVFSKYQNLGIKDLSMKLYPEMRHETLNEIGKEEVYQDVLHWLDDHLTT